MYEEFNKLKKKNPQLKTVLSLGGASAGIEKFRKLSTSDEDRKKFIKNTIKLLRKYNFDGLDLGKEKKQCVAFAIYLNTKIKIKTKNE